jgi:hypothetical protein
VFSYAAGRVGDAVLDLMKALGLAAEVSWRGGRARRGA